MGELNLSNENLQKLTEFVIKTPDNTCVCKLFVCDLLPGIILFCIFLFYCSFPVPVKIGMLVYLFWLLASALGLNSLDIIAASTADIEWTGLGITMY